MPPDCTEEAVGFLPLEISTSTTVQRVSRIHAPMAWYVPCDAATPVTPWSASCHAMVSQPGGYASQAQ
eukprot:2304414-Amphidinium_carterae.2